MDSEVLFVSPVEVFASQDETLAKSPHEVTFAEVLGNDDKFLRYDSSPESLGSYTDESIFSSIDEDGSLDVRSILETIHQQTVPYSDQFDTSISCPLPLNSLEQSLITTYLTDYPETLYQFRSDMKPHPTATLLSMAMTNPACLHLSLARSAQFRLLCNLYDSAKQQQDLEVTLIHHKCEAIQMIRNLSINAAPGKPSEDLLAAVVGLGRLDEFSGTQDTATMHYGAARQLVRSIGGPTQIQSVWLSRTMAHFECNHNLNTESCVWDRSDFGKLHTELNQFLSKTWSTDQSMPPPQNPRKRKSLHGKTGSISREHTPRTIIAPDSVLFQCLTRTFENLAEPSHQDRLEMISQLTCLLILCAVSVDYQSNQESLQAYMSTVEDLVVNSQSQDQAGNNLMWLLHIHDQSETHTKRVWATAGWVWILRHVSFNVQSMVRDWLIAVLTGKRVTRALKLDPFAFSYAS